MKTKLILILCFLCAGCASRPFEKWTREDTARQIAYTACQIGDWAQTTQIARNPDRYWELNPLLGEHPDEGKVHAFMAGSLIVNTIAPAMLKPKYRKVYQMFWIGLEGSLVLHNYSIGLKVEF